MVHHRLRVRHEEHEALGFTCSNFEGAKLFLSRDGARRAAVEQHRLDYGKGLREASISHTTRFIGELLFVKRCIRVSNDCRNMYWTPEIYVVLRESVVEPRERLDPM